LVLVLALVSACAPRAMPTPEPSATPLPPEPAVAPTAEVLPTATLMLPAENAQGLALPTAGPGTIALPTAGGVVLPSVCSPQVTASTIVNVRNGPGMIYSIVGALDQGETAQVDGKNADGTWWRILFPSAVDGHGWVAGSVTTTSCMNPSLPVIAVSSLPAPYQAAVTNVVVSVDPAEWTVSECSGEARRMTASATISASGPMQISYSFEIEGAGTAAPRTLTFTEYGSKTVTEDFKPEAVEGGHWVRLWIEGLNMQAWEYQTKYRIICE